MDEKSPIFFQRPDGLSNADYDWFMRYCFEFFADGPRLWRKDRQGAHKLVVNQPRRIFILRSAHDDVGHKGIYATQALVTERYWWPYI